MISAKGFLLSYLKYGDNDAILHCFTQENGYETFFMRGLYARTNKKKAYLQPLNELSLYFSKNKSGSIKNISKFDLVSKRDKDNDVKINTIIFFIADFLNQVLRNEGRNDNIYTEIEALLHELKSENHQCHLIFLFKVLKNNGIHPLNNEYSYLNPESGHFEPKESHQIFDETVSRIWKELSLAENPYSITISAKFRRNFLESLLVYYHYHFTDFRKPQSLEILQEIFN